MSLKKRIETCETCFFFEKLKVSKKLILTEGHCKLLELIHNKRDLNWSSFEVCKGEKNYHILESQLTEEQKEVFNELYENRLYYLEDLKVELDDPYYNPDDEKKEIVIELKKLGTNAKKYIEHIKFTK